MQQTEGKQLLRISCDLLRKENIELELLFLLIESSSTMV